MSFLYTTDIGVSCDNGQLEQVGAVATGTGTGDTVPVQTADPGATDTSGPTPVPTPTPTATDSADVPDMTSMQIEFTADSGDQTTATSPTVTPGG
jgi:hypothetical protein